MAFSRTVLASTLSEIFLFFGQAPELLLESIWFTVRGQINYRQLMRQMSDIGVGSLLVAIITVGFSGAVLALYASAQLASLSQSGLVGGLVGKSLALEITPVITAIVVSARSGSAMAAELGSMKVTEQVDALKTLATSPTQYLVAPRVLAMALMMPIVAAFANLAGLYGASWTASLSGISHASFWNSFQNYTQPIDGIEGLLKTIPFGILIALIGCRQGLATEGGAQGVGRSTTSAVVFACMAVYITDFFMSLIIQDFNTIWGGFGH
jgi:phospholipid/cholesterol/gamma-HCH transport system permease protein